MSLFLSMCYEGAALRSADGGTVREAGLRRVNDRGALQKKTAKEAVMQRTAVYPGSFDPVTNGHLDILKRGLQLFDKVIVAILINPGKRCLFTEQERVSLLRECLKDYPNTEVDTFQGLLVDFAAQNNAQAILRGLRAVSDFEYEMQLALMNRRLNRNIHTVFLMTGMRWVFTSSSIIKQAATFGGRIEGLVPPVVKEKLEEKMRHLKNPAS